MTRGLPDPLDPLQQRLGHSFENISLLKQALTHRSLGACNNERLEFLGDSILNFVIADEVYHRRPDSPEGDLSRLRATLVRGLTLAEVAKEWKLGDVIQLGGGEMKAGGHHRDSILADAVEAVLGAAFLDAGFARVREVILRHWQSRLTNLPSAESLKDPKTRLQEWLQSRSLALPEYETVHTSGADHDRSFVVECRLRDPKVSAQGRGTSRRKAQQAAARQVLALLAADGHG